MRGFFPLTAPAGAGPEAVAPVATGPEALGVVHHSLDIFLHSLAPNQNECWIFENCSMNPSCSEKRASWIQNSQFGELPRAPAALWNLRGAQACRDVKRSVLVFFATHSNMFLFRGCTRRERWTENFERARESNSCE